MDPRTRKELLALLPRLRRFARGLVGNTDEADDLVQTACERAIRNIDQWHLGTRLDSWMYRIVQSAWIDAVRARRTRDNYAKVVAATTLASTGGEKDAMNRLTLQSIQEALQQLPNEQRVVVLLICVEELSYAQAAEVLGVPVGTIMSRLARGRLALRRLVEGHEDNGSASIRPQVRGSDMG